LLSELRIAIENEVLVAGVEWEGLAQLLADPTVGRVSGDIEVQNAPSVVGDDKKAVEDSKGKCWDGEEIHGGDCFAVVLEEGLPLLGRFRPSGRVPQQTGDGSL
jgi:hypothetical protein